MKKIVILLMIIMGFVALPGPALAQELFVGTLFDHTGALKDWGPRHQNAAELAAKQLAAAGLEIDFVHKDSQTKAEAAKKAAEKLIAEDKVAAIIGSSSSGVIVPVAEAVTSPKNVLMISPGATSPFITDLPQDKDKDMLFRTCPSDTLQGVVLGKLEGMMGTAPGVAVGEAFLKLNTDYTAEFGEFPKSPFIANAYL